MKKKRAFTLAEVLVTLAVIGVVASMTIPALLSSYEEKETVAKLKKVYSVLSQATVMINADCDGSITNCMNNSVDSYSENSSAASTELMDLYREKLKIIKDCGLTGTGCFADEIYLRLSGADARNLGSDSVYNKLIINGISIALDWNAGVDSSVYGRFHFWIDVNGTKQPNQLGRDTFLISYNPNTNMLEPMGNTYQADTSDNVDNDIGYGCAARILREGAINY